MYLGIIWKIVVYIGRLDYFVNISGHEDYMTAHAEFSFKSRLVPQVISQWLSHFWLAFLKNYSKKSVTTDYLKKKIKYSVMTDFFKNKLKKSVNSYFSQKNLKGHYCFWIHIFTFLMTF